MGTESRSGYQETEAKFRIDPGDIERVRRELTVWGASLLSARQAEDNELFDFADGALRNAGCALRLRRYGEIQVVTFKGPVEDDPLLKRREELETSVKDGQILKDILARLGLRVTFRYSKQREVFQMDWEGHSVQICIDGTPVGDFVEIEGPAEAIHILAHRLGFTRYIKKSYIELYSEKAEDTDSCKD